MVGNGGRRSLTLQQTSSLLGMCDDVVDFVVVAVVIVVVAVVVVVVADMLMAPLDCGIATQVSNQLKCSAEP